MDFTYLSMSVFKIKTSVNCAMHFSEAALFSLLEFIFRSCRPYNLLLRIDVNFPLWIDHFFFFFVYGYNEVQ